MLRAFGTVGLPRIAVPVTVSKDKMSQDTGLNSCQDPARPTLEGRRRQGVKKNKGRLRLAKTPCCHSFKGQANFSLQALPLSSAFSDRIHFRTTENSALLIKALGCYVFSGTHREHDVRAVRTARTHRCFVVLQGVRKQAPDFPKFKLPAGKRLGC